MTSIFENCQLEVDLVRGVIYVHSKDTGHTLLRVCGLKGQLPIRMNQTSVNFPHLNITVKDSVVGYSD